MRHVLCSLLLLTACAPPAEPPHALYAADALASDNPFPDLRLVERGAVREGWYARLLPPRALTRQMKAVLAGYAASMATVEGVGNFGPTLLPLSARVDPASVPGTVARLVRTGGGWEVLEAAVAVEVSRAALAREQLEVPDDFPELLVTRPAVVLPELAEGMLVLKRGLVAESGEPFGRGFDAEEDPEQASLRRAAAQALGIEEREVLLALRLRAAPVKARLERLAAWAEAMEPPRATVEAHRVLELGGGRYPDGVWTPADADWPLLSDWLERHDWSRPADRVGRVVYGTLPLKDLRAAGVWSEDFVQNPDAAPTVGVRFAVVVPSGAKPPGGWPVVVGAHGINNRNTTLLGDPNSFCLELGQLFARAGVACAGIDATSHGSRGNPFLFFDVENLAVLRDNFRQMVVDQMQLVRALPALDVDGDGAGDFRREVGYLGNSLGGIMGTGLLAADPRVRAAVLNVAGGGLANVLEGEEIRDRIGLLLVAKTGLVFHSPEYFASFPLYRAASQLVLEPADPINLAQLVSPDKAVLLQEGVGDFAIPNFTSENLAAALKAEASAQEQRGAALKLLFRADPAAYLPPARLPGYNSHNLLWESGADALRAQAVRFLASGGTEFSPDGAMQ